MSCGGYECPGCEVCREEMDRLAYESDLQECHEYAMYYEAEMERIHAEMVKETATVSDGFGGIWAKCGADCTLEVVRPGKVQCGGPCIGEPREL